MRRDERAIVEPGSREIRSVFEVHRISEVFADLAADPRVAGRARQILGSDVCVHQSRVNVKPGFGASGFYWHSDFETCLAEDGLPQMRTVSVSIALIPNYAGRARARADEGVLEVGPLIGPLRRGAPWDGRALRSVACEGRMALVRDSNVRVPIPRTKG